jgi:hypothetical protein
MTEQDIRDMKDELEQLLSAKPETGEAGADICLLEQQIIEAQKQYNDDNGQFGVGA